MMNSGSSSSGLPIDKNNELDFDFDFDLESWINELQFDNYGELVVNSGVDTTTITPNYPSQPIISTINGGTSVEGSSANQNSMQSQGGFFHDIITASMMTSNNSTATQHRSGQVLPDVPKFATNPVGQSSQSRKAKDVPQNQPLLHQVFKNKAVQQPLTHSLSNQSNITFGDQKNQLVQLHYQMPSNQLLPCTRPVANTQTGNLQNNQPSRRQIQQNPNQKQLQLQQGTGTSGNLISGGKKRRNKTQVNLSDPVGFATPTEYPSSLVWREYVLRQIRNMKERYFNELRTMHHNAIQFHNQAKNVDAAREYGNVKTYIAKMVAFLNITTVDAIPQNDERVYNYMNIIVNYMNYHKNKTGGSSQYTPPLNPSQGILNLEANMVNFNQNFPSRKPRGRMPNSLKNTSFQMSVDQKPVNPLRSGSFKAPQAIVINTTQQINPGSNTSNINRSGSPVSLFSNTNGNNFPSCPINHQPSVPNQNNLEKMKQPMQKPNEFFLPPAAKSISQQTSPQWSPLSVSSSSFDVNTLLSPQTIASSPFLLSSKSTQSGVSSVSSLGSEKLKTPVDPCSKKDQEPESSKDPISHLIQVVNSISPKTLGSSLKDISSIETLMDYIPPNIPGSYMLDDGDFISEYDHEAQSKMSRNLNVSSVYQDQDQFDFDEWDIFSTETSPNKRPKIENKGTILEEIKEINGNLLETSMHVVSDSTEDNISMFGGEEGTIVKCLFKNVCFPDLLGSASSEKMPEFVIQLLVPLNYPVSAPTILKSGRNVLSEPWEMLYGETMTRFDLSLREVSGQISLGEMARNWDSSARSVMTEFVKKRGGKSFSFRNGSWENCINSSSGSN